MVKVGINGFGRIGRNVFRAALNNPDVQIVAVNDLTDVATLAHLLKYDTTHGIIDATVEVGDGAIIVNGRSIKIFAERDPGNLPWKDYGVEIVVESTGIFTAKEKASLHLKGGAKKVIISALALTMTNTMHPSIQLSPMLLVQRTVWLLWPKLSMINSESSKG